MQRHRVLVAFGVAWISALVLSWWVYKTTAAPQNRQIVQAVAAARDLPVGQRIKAGDLKFIAVDPKDLPKGAFFKFPDVLDRAVITSVSSNELVLDRALAPRGAGEGMTALIEPGMRAVSVQVNEISGVSGFIQPGSRVDVLYTRMFSNGDAAATTVLQNVKVIAYGKQLEPQPAQTKVDPRETSKITVATLLVTQEDAEKLALAVQRGRIQLVLRNPLDEQILDDSGPVNSDDLGIEEPKKEPPARAVPPPPRPLPAPPKPPAASGAVEQRVPADNNPIVIRVFRGSKVTEDIFE